MAAAAASYRGAAAASSSAAGGSTAAGAACGNCSAAPGTLYCGRCAAALCAACAASIHAAPVARSHRLQPRGEAAFDAIVGRLGGDLTVVTETLLARLPAGRSIITVSEAVVTASLRSGAAAALRAAAPEVAWKLIRPSRAEPPPRVAPSAAECDAAVAPLDVRGLHALLAATGRLGAHAAVVTGPFPAVVTTNWDGLLEAAWEGVSDDQIACPKRTSEYLHREWAHAAAVIASDADAVSA